MMLAQCLEKEEKAIQTGIIYPGAVSTAIYNKAVSQSPKTFPDQPIYQAFIDNNTVKTASQAAKECVSFLLNSSDIQFNKSVYQDFK